jgi:hypothetical protein
MVTLGVSLMLGELANRYSNITGGADGMQGIRIGPILGLFRFDMYGHNGYIYCLIVLFICFFIARRIVYSPFGLSLRSLKGNPLRASAIGIPVNRRLVAIYTVSAGFAGISGALLTQTTAFCSLDVFSLERSADLLLVLIIGGTGYLYGGLIGAVIYKFLQDWLASLTPQYWQFWIGLVLVVIVLIGRERVDGWTKALRASISRFGARLVTRPAAIGGAGRTLSHADSRNDRPRKAVRRHRRGARRVVVDREGRAARADRPERRRQDHRDQSAHRRPQADRRQHHSRRQGHHGAGAVSARAARHGAYIPDQPAVP